MAPLTYLELLAIAILGPIAVLAATGTGIAPERRRAAVAGTLVIVAIAVVYTVPWDNYLVSLGVWHYPEGDVVGRIWHAPVEEYLFIALQPMLTALYLYRRSLPSVDRTAVRLTDLRRMLSGSARPRRVLSPTVLAVAAWLAIAGWGLLALNGKTFYLSAILAWAAPVLALQWAVGGNYLWAVRRRVALSAGVPTVYLCLVDRIAIGWELWVLSPEFTTGWTVLGLPVEEAVFFLVTNLLVVQGLLLFHWVIEQWQ